MHPILFHSLYLSSLLFYFVYVSSFAGKEICLVLGFRYKSFALVAVDSTLYRNDELFTGLKESPPLIYYTENIQTHDIPVLHHFIGCHMPNMSNFFFISTLSFVQERVQWSPFIVHASIFTRNFRLLKAIISIVILFHILKNFHHLIIECTWQHFEELPSFRHWVRMAVSLWVYVKCFIWVTRLHCLGKLFARKVSILVLFNLQALFQCKILDAPFSSSHFKL